MTLRTPAADAFAALGAAWPSCKERSRERPLRKARLRTRGPFSGGSLPRGRAFATATLARPGQIRKSLK